MAEYLYCGAELGRDEFPFTCYRRIAHSGGCGPVPDSDPAEQEADMADAAPRFVVEDLGGGWAAVLDTRTQLSYDVSTSRRRAEREADRRNAAEDGCRG